MFISDITKKEYNDDQKIFATQLQEQLFQLIVSDCPGFTRKSLLSKDEIQKYRKHYILSKISNDVHTLTELESEVLNSLHANTIVSEEIVENQNENFTFGQKLADRIASFGGSWTFIILFFIVLFTWIGTNVFLLTFPFDPYPFILLNLILSCIAALQAPVIMMSQNRQEEKDRIRSKSDYKINLKSELEIRMLHEKVDHLILHQQKNLLEIQQIQLDILNEILSKLSQK